MDNLIGGEETLSVAEAMEALQVSRVTLWRWIQAGRLPAYRLGARRVRIKKRDLDALLQPLDAEARRRRDLQAAIREAERVQEAILRRRGGRVVNDSGDLLQRLRDDRDAEA